MDFGLWKAAMPLWRVTGKWRRFECVFPARYHGSKILYLPVSQQLRHPHFLAEKKKLFRSASFLITSNLGELKCGLIHSQTLRNRMVSLFLSAVPLHRDGKQIPWTWVRLHRSQKQFLSEGIRLSRGQKQFLSGWIPLPRCQKQFLWDEKEFLRDQKVFLQAEINSLQMGLFL